MSDDNYIPVDDAMLRFENHLFSHDMVILSARFIMMECVILLWGEPTLP